MRGKKINSRAEIPQNLFRIAPVSFYKREKEDREFFIGLIFHTKKLLLFLTS